MAYWIAATTGAPEEPPHIKPSSSINLLAILSEVLSSDLNHLSTKDLSKILGTKSYPIPSTKLPGAGGFKVYDIARILPKGSTPRIYIFLFFSFNFLLIPVIPPPVPTPMNTPFKFPEVYQ